MKNESAIIKGTTSNTYIGEAAELYRNIDSKVTSFLTGYRCQDIIIPSLISSDVLEKGGYFTDFPHYLNVTKPLNELENNINYLELDFLTPAACLGVYPLYKKYLTAYEIITSLVKVFRNENGYSDVRNKEYSIREIIFFGEKNRVIEMMDDIWGKIVDLATTLYGNVTTSNAEDNFYPNESTRLKKELQKANSLKEELLFNYNSNMVAVASKNYHMNHFSKSYEFDDAGKIVTGCIGVGLDRWVTILITNGGPL